MTNLLVKSIFTSLLFFLLSCSSNSNDHDVIENENLIEEINLSEQLGLDSGQVKIFTMPTPLQIASVLKIMEVDYNNELLLENGMIKSNSDIDLSLLLGMYLTDLGYTSIYNNTQKSLSYAKDIQYIMEELPISYYINDEFRKRIQKNINHQDSLSKTILEGYNEANQHFTETGNEGLGLLILTGAYIEGLYLATSVKVNTNWLKEYNNTLIQQKIFLDNFILLLEGYTINSKIATVVTQLKKLKLTFDKITINFNDDTKSYNLTQPILMEEKEEINTVITQIRSSIIAVKQ